MKLNSTSYGLALLFFKPHDNAIGGSFDENVFLKNGKDDFMNG